MKFIFTLSAALLICTAHAQDLKVITLSEGGNHHPVPNVLIRLHYGWETAPDRNRKFKYYRLTEKGKKQSVVEAVTSVMWPTAEES